MTLIVWYQVPNNAFEIHNVYRVFITDIQYIQLYKSFKYLIDSLLFIDSTFFIVFINSNNKEIIT